MKKKILIALMALSALFLGAGCGPLAAGEETGGDSKNISAEESSRELTLDEKVDAIVSSMSTTEKIGQLVMIGVQGTDANEDSLYVLHQFHYGGIILFDRNMESAAQTRAMVEHLQAGAEEKLPLFVAIDEEGGAVVRGSDFLEPPPSQEEVGATGSPSVAREHAVRVARDLKDLGVNVNFAPVADVGAGAGRSFSADPEETARFVRAAGEGYQEAGMVYALKHFPGIGRGLVDSHQEISSIEASREELWASDLVPFRSAIEATDRGRSLDYMVMVGHLNYPALDADNPASLSPAIITGLLREELGFEGLVITDDLEMGAIAKHLTFRQAGIAAIEAGADLVLVCHEYEHAEQAYMGIYDALESGRLSKERLEESVRRVVKAKLLHNMN